VVVVVVASINLIDGVSIHISIIKYSMAIGGNYHDLWNGGG